MNEWLAQRAVQRPTLVKEKGKKIIYATKCHCVRPPGANPFVLLQERRSKNGSVVLRNVTHSSSGEYECEISAEPTFQSKLLAFARVKETVVVKCLSSFPFVSPLCVCLCLCVCVNPPDLAIASKVSLSVLEPGELANKSPLGKKEVCKRKNTSVTLAPRVISWLKVIYLPPCIHMPDQSPFLDTRAESRSKWHTHTHIYIHTHINTREKEKTCTWVHSRMTGCVDTHTLHGCGCDGERCRRQRDVNV